MPLYSSKQKTEKTVIASSSSPNTPKGFSPEEEAYTPEIPVFELHADKNVFGETYSDIKEGVISTVNSAKDALSGLKDATSEGAKAFFLKAFKELKNLTPTAIPGKVLRDYMSLVNWSSEHLWEVSLEGLKGLFKVYCPMSDMFIEMDKLDIGTMQVGNFSFSYPVGSSSRSVTAVFQDDIYCSVAIALSEWMNTIYGNRQTGVVPLVHAGRKLVFRALSRSKVEVTRLNIIAIPTGVIPIQNSQSTKARDVAVTFLIAGLEVISSGLPVTLSGADPARNISDIPMDTQSLSQLMDTTPAQFFKEFFK